MRNDSVMRTLYFILEAATQGSYHEVTGPKDTWFCTTDECRALKWSCERTIANIPFTGPGRKDPCVEATRAFFAKIFVSVRKYDEMAYRRRLSAGDIRSIARALSLKPLRYDVDMKMVKIGGLDMEVNEINKDRRNRILSPTTGRPLPQMELDPWGRCIEPKQMDCWSYCGECNHLLVHLKKAEMWTFFQC